MYFFFVGDRQRFLLVDILGIRISNGNLNNSRENLSIGCGYNWCSMLQAQSFFVHIDLNVMLTITDDEWVASLLWWIHWQNRLPTPWRLQKAGGDVEVKAAFEKLRQPVSVFLSFIPDSPPAPLSCLPSDSSLCWRASYRLPSHVRRAQSGLITLPLVALPAAVGKRDERGERWSEYQPGRFLEVGRRRVFVITRTWCLETGRRQGGGGGVGHCEEAWCWCEVSSPRGLKENLEKLVAELISLCHITRRHQFKWAHFSRFLSWLMNSCLWSFFFLFALQALKNVHVFLSMLFAHAYFMALLCRSVWSTVSLIGLEPGFVFSQPRPSRLRKSSIAHSDGVHSFQQSKPVPTTWCFAMFSEISSDL